MADMNFHQPLLLSSVSRDTSEIIILCSFATQEIFIIIISFENGCIL